MAVAVTLLPVLLLFPVYLWPFVTQANQLTVDCSFGKAEDLASNLTMSAMVTGRLAASKYQSHLCVVKTSGSSHQKRFLQVKAKILNSESNGFLHASVYGTDKPQLLGNLDVWKSKGDWSSLIICPSRDHNNKDQEKHLVLSGTPNLAFRVQVESSVVKVVLNKPLTFDLGLYESFKVFQFIPTEDILDMQLDVTVTSESDDVPAYLKVSRDCKDVNENIDVVDYKGESIRLSFAKKGRITLSRVSIPPLTDSTSSWFIGIAIKNATGLIAVLLYNGIEMKENSGERGFVDAANFFLYFLVPLYIFNYFGTLSHSETELVNAPAFFTFVVIWWIFITFWTGWKLFPDFSCSRIKENLCKCIWFCVSFVLPFIVCWVSSSNIPQAFLIICILEGAIAIIGNALCNWKKIKWAKCEESACNVCIQVAYIVLMVILWCVAGWIFAEKATTDKTLTPEKSRDYNQECIILNFFDAHDLWHILSSHALLMSAYVVMFMSHKED